MKETNSTTMDDKELTRLAQQELQQEAFRAKSRAEVMGSTGWQRCPLPTTNKRFLHNMVISTLEPWKKKAKQAHSTNKNEDTNSKPLTSTQQREQNEHHLKSDSERRSSTGNRHHKHKRKHREEKNRRDNKKKSKHRKERTR